MNMTAKFLIVDIDSDFVESIPTDSDGCLMTSDLTYALQYNTEKEAYETLDKIIEAYKEFGLPDASKIFDVKEMIL